MEEYQLYGLPKLSKSIISSALPDNVIKQREGGGRRTLSYISGATVTDLLNAAFEYNWNWEVKQFFIQESVPYLDKRSNKKIDQSPVAHVLGTLTVKFKDKNGTILTISKDGFGSKSILGKQADQESIFKAADTDALKKAASRFGIGLELYRDEEEQDFFDIINDDTEEDVWTDEALKEYEDELNYITTIKEQLDDEGQLNQLIFEFSEGNLSGIGDITPDNIKAFCNFIKELQKEAEE